MPEPLHPAVVHFPLVLAALLPLFILGCWVGVARGVKPLCAWSIVVLMQALLVGSALFATGTGEDEEEVVEKVVAEEHIEAHERGAKAVQIGSIVVLVISLLGLLQGKLGTIGRGLTLACSGVLLYFAIDTGSSGGALVYEHGAASAYTGDK